MSLSPLSGSQRMGSFHQPTQPLTQAERQALKLAQEAQSLASINWVLIQLKALDSSHPEIIQAIQQLGQKVTFSTRSEFGKL